MIISSGPPALSYQILDNGHLETENSQPWSWLQPTCIADVPYLWDTDGSTPYDLHATMVFLDVNVKLILDADGIKCHHNDRNGHVWVCEVGPLDGAAAS
jgi:hypothetical protein